MNIRDKDLNLLKIFHIIYQEKNISKAAERLELSQPALSHKLNKLRNELGDPLFIKAPRGLTPTPKAHSIAEHVGNMIKGIESFYLSQSEEDFLTRPDRINIYTTDYMEQRLFPHLLPLVRKKAPNLVLVAHDTRGKLPSTELEDGRCDLAIAGFYSDLPKTMRQQRISEERFVVLASKQNSVIDERLELKDYLECEHILTTLSGDLDGKIDLILKERGLSRSVVAGFSSFLSPPSIIRNSDMLVTCLESIADQAIALDSGLVKHPLPFVMPKVDIMQFWHERTHVDPLRKWLREQVSELLSRV
ncbi:lysR-family transcriptional regulator [Vibrio ishigakensis]|uniref:LysR-family transcriptional regulator n=1 Tax=Vibrio ishigakensis TaxID=1481914 RepID=A0A0B8NP01_9VIBR|nr:LysR family transcriptional regulator [Vibrio ishigakensis]GAM54057.1 lysR-family transcriptional regulator [Vibrio ishigakensis]